MSFADDIKRFADKTSKAHDEITRGTTIALFNAVINDTPVDTGRARGNWQTTVGQPATNQIERDGASASIAEAVANTPKGAGQETMLANNLPYIVDLENGTSKQAPQGMVHRNVDRFQRLIDEQARKNRV
jgi:hypothetical protein